jgi:hypothetical protein
MAKRDGTSEQRKTQSFVSSPWWSIEYGQALIRDPSGKFEITGAAKVYYNEKLPSGRKRPAGSAFCGRHVTGTLSLTMLREACLNAWRLVRLALVCGTLLN